MMVEERESKKVVCRGRLRCKKKITLHTYFLSGKFIILFGVGHSLDLLYRPGNKKYLYLLSSPLQVSEGS